MPKSNSSTHSSQAGSEPSQLYRYPSLDDVEDVEQYRRGGLHPIDLDDVLDNRYKIVHKLGHGGFATIWLARVLNEKRYVAIKVLTARGPVEDLKFLTYLQDRGANHPSIVCLQDAFMLQGPNGRHQCLVFDSVGPSLNRLSANPHHLSGSMARHAAQQIAEGVSHLHSAGIAHGGKKAVAPLLQPFVANLTLDLTSSNILFEIKNFDGWTEHEVYQYLGEPRRATLRLLSGAPAGPQGPVKVVEAVQYSDIGEKQLTGNVRIIDFGESFFLSKPPPGFLGTPAGYFAPEMLFGWSASAASDVWALGCLIFEVHASRPLICVFFGRLDEALSEVVHTIGPVPRAWQHSYYDKSVQKDFKQNHPWFDASDLRHPLQSLLSQIKPHLTAKDIANLLGLLKACLEYEPKYRLSADRVAKHPWFA
jgi:serine/threonine-protein kinase SRPK3